MAAMRGHGEGGQTFLLSAFLSRSWFPKRVSMYWLQESKREERILTQTSAESKNLT